MKYFSRPKKKKNQKNHKNANDIVINKKYNALLELGHKSDAGVLPAAYVWCCSSLLSFVLKTKQKKKKNF